MTDLEKHIETMVTAIVRRELATATTAPFTVAQYAERWQISESTVRQAISDGRLDVIRNGRSIRIAPDSRISRRPRERRERARLALLRGGSVK